MSTNLITWIAIRRALLMVITALDKHFGFDPKKTTITTRD